MAEEIDPKWIEENVEKSDLPEAPASIHIDSYLYGFHVGWTKRLTDNNIAQQVGGVNAFVKSLISYGYEPSWNKETSKVALNGNGHAEPEKAGCQHPETEVRVTQSGKNQGKSYKRCTACNAFVAWV